MRPASRRPRRAEQSHRNKDRPYLHGTGQGERQEHAGTDTLDTVSRDEHQPSIGAICNMSGRQHQQHKRKKLRETHETADKAGCA